MSDPSTPHPLDLRTGSPHDGDEGSAKTTGDYNVQNPTNTTPLPSPKSLHRSRSHERVPSLLRNISPRNDPTTESDMQHQTQSQHPPSTAPRHPEEALARGSPLTPFLSTLRSEASSRRISTDTERSTSSSISLSSLSSSPQPYSSPETLGPNSTPSTSTRSYRLGAGYSCSLSSGSSSSYYGWRSGVGYGGMGLGSGNGKKGSYFRSRTVRTLGEFNSGILLRLQWTQMIAVTLIQGFLSIILIIERKRKDGNESISDIVQKFIIQVGVASIMHGSSYLLIRFRNWNFLPAIWNSFCLILVVLNSSGHLLHDPEKSVTEPYPHFILLALMVVIPISLLLARPILSSLMLILALGQSVLCGCLFFYFHEQHNQQLNQQQQQQNQQQHYYFLTSASTMTSIRLSGVLLSYVWILVSVRKSRIEILQQEKKRSEEADGSLLCIMNSIAFMVRAALNDILLSLPLVRSRIIQAQKKERENQKRNSRSRKNSMGMDMNHPYHSKRRYSCIAAIPSPTKTRKKTNFNPTPTSSTQKRNRSPSSPPQLSQSQSVIGDCYSPLKDWEFSPFGSISNSPQQTRNECYRPIPKMSIGEICRIMKFEGSGMIRMVESAEQYLSQHNKETILMSSSSIKMKFKTKIEDKKKKKKKKKKKSQRTNDNDDERWCDLHSDLRLAIITQRQQYLEGRAKGDRVELIEMFPLSTDFPALIKCDSGRICRVLQNLVSNALKYTDEGTVTIQVDYSVEERRLRVVVGDTGIGIDPENLSKIFTPFSTIHEEREDISSMNLGLWASKQMVRKMGGSLEVESDGLGTGTTATLSIPLARFKLAKQKTSRSRENSLTSFTSDSTSASSSLKNYRFGSVQPSNVDDLNLIELEDLPVYIVEDSQSTVMVMSRVLERCGVHPDNVRCAYDGLSGLNMIRNDYNECANESRRWIVPLVLMDLGLPVLSGLECIAQLRSMKLPCTIIAATGTIVTSDNFIEEHLLDGIMVKPFALDEFRTVLNLAQEKATTIYPSSRLEADESDDSGEEEGESSRFSFHIKTDLVGILLKAINVVIFHFIDNAILSEIGPAIAATAFYVYRDVYLKSPVRFFSISCFLSLFARLRLIADGCFAEGTFLAFGVASLYHASQLWDPCLFLLAFVILFSVRFGKKGEVDYSLSILITISTMIRILASTFAFLYSTTRDVLQSIESGRLAQKQHLWTQRFLAKIIHDLRRPATSLQRQIDDLLRLSYNDPPTQELLRLQDRSVAELWFRIHDLANLVRLSADKMNSFKCDVDLVALLDECIEEQRRRYCSTLLRLQYDRRSLSFSSVASRVRIDREKLLQVVSNILSNALKHASSRVSVSATVDDSTNEFSLTVVDDGPGLLNGISVFEPTDPYHFEFGKKVFGVESGVVGLSVSTVFAREYLNGSLKIRTREDEEETGAIAEFRCFLEVPIVSSNDDDEESTRHSKLLRCLVLDDQPVALRSSVFILNTTPTLCLEADGFQTISNTIQAVEQKRYDVAFLDRQLGKKGTMRGEQVAKILIGIQPQLQIILATGDMIVSLDEVARFGVQQVARKPLDRTGFQEILRHCQERQSTQITSEGESTDGEEGETRN